MAHSTSDFGMEDIWNFLSSTNAKQTVIRGPVTCGLKVTKDDSEGRLDRRSDHRYSKTTPGTAYAEEYRQREQELYLENESEPGTAYARDYGGTLSSLEKLSTVDDGITTTVGDVSEDVLMQVYKNYSFVKEINPNLSINENKDEILQSMKSQPILIIEGPTGCGKTTQVPQWILDNAYENHQHCNIVVTQPRRIAAMSIAKRVAQERGWDVGGIVGYQVGLDNKTTTDTRLQYVTTGVLLQKLVAAQSLRPFTHIILDEIHERGQEMDFLIIVVRKMLFTNSKHVKVILMSATFNIDDFARYFATPNAGGYMEKVPSITIEKKSPFTVKLFYLNQLEKFSNLPSIKEDEPCITSLGHDVVVKLLKVFDVIDKSENEYEEENDEDTVPSVLIFLPGINEIEDLFNKLGDRKYIGDVTKCMDDPKWWVVPLHSTITSDEQARVFQKAKPGYRKVILSTNIAESSITVSDIKYVIDFCLMKVLVADPSTNFTSLQLRWASKANCMQRAGRAGRVRDGRVYRLVPEYFYHNLPQDCEPEMKRCPLERLVLLAKTLNIGSPKAVLALAMDPPELSNIQRTVLTLKEMGALLKTLDGEISLEDGDMTYLGRVMAKLPVDVRVSKLILLGYVFGCLKECIIMGAAMSVKNVFSAPFQERLNAYNSKLTWADGSTSDCIAYLSAYKVWEFMKMKHNFAQSERHWARKFYLQVRALRELHDMVVELSRRLSREGIEEAPEARIWRDTELGVALKVLLAGAFYPNYFVQPGRDEADECEALRALGGLEPRATVYLQGFPHDQPGDVYTGALKHALRKYIDDDFTVTFDGNSSKAFLTFQDPNDKRRTDVQEMNPTIPGKVVFPVYKAVKIRQLNLPIVINLLPVEKALQLQQQYAAEAQAVNNRMLLPKLPDIDETHMPISICELVDCGRFWAWYDDQSTKEDLGIIYRELNSKPLLAVTRDIKVGDVFAAPKTTEKGLCRVTIEKLMPQDMLKVYYIDNGGYEKVNRCTLRELPKGSISRDFPPAAMECRLAQVAPSQHLNPHKQWTPQAIAFLRDIIKRPNTKLMAQVYSVTYNVVSVFLLVERNRSHETININDLLIEKGFAQFSEESYESKVNHDLRQSVPHKNLSQIKAMNEQQARLATRVHREVPPPSIRDCYTDCRLKGPFSPLETTLQGLMYSGRQKVVHVEWNSVNSVLLESEPDDPCQRLLVAASVGQNQEGSKLTLRHTTLLPHQRGLPAILAMLFCPTMELRRNKSRSAYASVLCGLGALPDGKPYFPEHDLLVPMDAHITQHDLEQINHIRHLMDFMLYCREGQDAPVVSDKNKADVPKTIRQNLNGLIWRTRKHVQRCSVADAWEWGSAPADELQTPDMPQMGDAAIFPLHSALHLHARTDNQLRLLHVDNIKLKDAVNRPGLSSFSRQDYTCELCGTAAMSLQAMRIHLYSRAHIDNEEDLRRFDS